MYIDDLSVPAVSRDPKRRIKQLAALYVNSHFHNLGTIVFWEENNFRFADPYFLHKFAKDVTDRGVLKHIHGLELRINVNDWCFREEWIEIIPRLNTLFPHLKRVVVFFLEWYCKEGNDYHADVPWGHDKDFKPGFIEMKAYLQQHLRGKNVVIEGLLHRENYWRETPLQFELGRRESVMETSEEENTSGDHAR